MKIVQSLWSKPGQQKKGMSLADLNKCGWPDKKYNYFSWVLSVLQFRKFYDELELVTDHAGYELLVEKLELPYTNVVVALDVLNDYHPDLWALGKLYTYSIQETPFIHADGDVYIWKKFDEDFEQAPLLCQREEKGASFNRMYSRVFLDMIKHFEFYPPVLDQSINRNQGIVAMNAGIIGGHDIAFFKQYTKQAFAFIDRNAAHLEKINVGLSNIVFEQFLFYALAEEAAAPVAYFNADVNDLLNDFSNFLGVPHTTTYIHTPGSLKQQRPLTDALEYRLLTDYPDYYYKVLHLIRTNQI